MSINSSNLIDKGGIKLKLSKMDTGHIPETIDEDKDSEKTIKCKDSMMTSTDFRKSK